MASCKPVPYYSDVCQASKETHGVTTYVYKYSAAIKIENAWVVPSENQVTILNVENLVNIVVGASLWHPLFGYYLIVAFDPIRHALTIENRLNEGTGLVFPHPLHVMVSAPK